MAKAATKAATKDTEGKGGRAYGGGLNLPKAVGRLRSGVPGGVQRRRPGGGGVCQVALVDLIACRVESHRADR